MSLASTVTFANSGLVAPSSAFKSAMTERLCVWDDNDPAGRGKTTPEYVRVYEEFGKGGLGLVILGNIPVDRDAVEAKKNCIIDARSSYDPVESLRPAIAGAKAHGSLVLGQLSHGGRQVPTDVTEHPVSASDVQCGPMMGMTFAKPRPLTVSEIDGLVEAWGYAAEVLYKAGADGTQLHAAHGYLLSQFLSGRTNRRTDDYGGSLENRYRFVARVLDEIRRKVPDQKFMLSIKLNSADFDEGGLTPEESKQVCIWLDNAGVDLIELSGGSYESMALEHKKESTRRREAYFVEFADAIRPVLKTAKLAVTGGFRSKQAMEQALADGAADLVGLARPLTAEPTLIRDMIAGKTAAARENKFPEPMQTGAGIVQIAAISKGEPIPDLSVQDEVERVLEALKGGAMEVKPVKDQNTSSYHKSEDQY